MVNSSATIKGFPLLFFISSAMTLSGCATPSNQPASIGADSGNAETECGIEATSSRCILELAAGELAQTGDAFAWASAAAELAIAYDATGQSSKSNILVDQAILKSQEIVDAKKRGAVLTEIVVAMAEFKPQAGAKTLLDRISSEAENVPESNRANIMAKRVIADGVHGDTTKALAAAIALPQDTQLGANHKAVTLRKLAGILAKNKDFTGARQAIDAITMSIVYYQSMVRSDVARHAYKAGEKDLTVALLTEAEPIARSQKDGYFKGAALRDIGYSFHKMGETDKAAQFFKDARAATATAKKPNERARSTSRIATRLADAGLQARSKPILEDAIAFATDIESATIKGYTFYEIAGSAAFSGAFDITRSLLPQIPNSPLGSASSLKDVSLRDLAWGLTRQQKIAEAISVAKSIGSSRAKIHALSRMVRLLENPNMDAPPRYL